MLLAGGRGAVVEATGRCEVVAGRAVAGRVGDGVADTTGVGLIVAEADGWVGVTEGRSAGATVVGSDVTISETGAAGTVSEGGGVDVTIACGAADVDAGGGGVGVGVIVARAEELVTGAGVTVTVGVGVTVGAGVTVGVGVGVAVTAGRCVTVAGGGLVGALGVTGAASNRYRLYCRMMLITRSA